MTKEQIIKKATKDAMYAIHDIIEKTLEWKTIVEVDRNYKEIVDEIKDEVKRRLIIELKE